jgi:hypothetical protein
MLCMSANAFGSEFIYINWLPEDREQGYSKLIEACRLPAKPSVAEAMLCSTNLKRHKPDFAYQNDLLCAPN